MFQRGSTHFLRTAIVMIGLGVLALCIFALPEIWRGGSAEFPEVGWSVKAIVIGLYITAVPFYIALWQTLKLLGYIDKNVAFSDLSVRVIRNIKYCAIAITAVFATFVLFLYPIAEVDDAPGLMLMGMGIACAPLVVAVFAAVLERLLRNAIEIKSENDLTV